jgi:hypothetical protein
MVYLISGIGHLPGGDLWTYLYSTMTNEDRGSFGGMKLLPATLYAGTVLLALEHIHELGYRYV